MIRRACRNDAKAVVNVINESNYHAYKGMMPKEYFKYSVVTVDRILRDMEFYVYKLNDQIIGVIALLPRFNEGVGTISWVYVHLKY